MSTTTQVASPQSASLVLSILQSKAGNRWGRAVQEMKERRLTVSGDFLEFVVTNKSGARLHRARLKPQRPSLPRHRLTRRGTLFLRSSARLIT